MDSKDDPSKRGFPPSSRMVHEQIFQGECGISAYRVYEWPGHTYLEPGTFVETSDGRFGIVEGISFVTREGALYDVTLQGDTEASPFFRDSLRPTEKPEPSEKQDEILLSLALEKQRILLRATVVPEHHVHQPHVEILLPRRMIVMDKTGLLGGPPSDELDELEELINNPKAKEQDIQRFLEGHPHYFSLFDYTQIHPHVCLGNEEGLLIPDFILTDQELQKAAIIELKLPSAKIIRRKKNRDHFTSAVEEARAQLLHYKAWFRERSNRILIKQKIGMEVYEPDLTVIIGRSSEFISALDRQILRSANPGIELVTYDDLITHTRRRTFII